MLDIACHRCERRGRVSLARLIEEHGADMGLPDLWESLAGDCAAISQGEFQTALNFVLRQFFEIFSVAFGAWRLAILSAALTLSPQPYDARSAR